MLIAMSVYTMNKRVSRWLNSPFYTNPPKKTSASLRELFSRNFSVRGGNYKGASRLF